MARHADFPTEHAFTRLWNANPRVRDTVLIVAPIAAVVFGAFLYGGAGAGGTGGGG